MREADLRPDMRIGGSRIVFAPPPGGFGARFYALDNDEGVVGFVTVDATKQGPPGHVHGGASATLVDEAMGASAWFSGRRVVAVNLNINLKHAVPLEQELRLEGRVVKQEGRKVFTIGALILPDGRVAVEGSGIFVIAPPELVGASEQFNPFKRLVEHPDHDDMGVT